MATPFGAKRRMRLTDVVATGAGQGATFGLADDLVGLVRPDMAARMRANAEDAEAAMPGVFAASEVAGSMAVPMPLFGAGAAARALRNMRGVAKVAGPRVLKHGSPEPWILRGDRPQLDIGEGLGLHAGTKAQAKDILDVPALKNYKLDDLVNSVLLRGPAIKLRLRGPTFGHGYIDDVRFGAGREIETPDLGSWSSGPWAAALLHGQVKGLSPRETGQILDALRTLQRAGGWAHEQPQIRQILRSHGIQRIKYINEVEGPGRYSYVALDPAIIAPGSIFSKTAKAAGAGAMAGVLYPEDAHGPADLRERPGVSGGARRRARDDRLAEQPPALKRRKPRQLSGRA